ncbi:hypothetical protein ACLI4U_17790 [Natrialbaceae archaeon A-CW2]|uniref:hypothetical protein n=1 Tax=Natronosalvus amylolyticus TaxID=2961994 RepID=UPI0020C95B0C|nr:hypothetical protein [Natronosalvus amylolyticus]
MASKQRFAETTTRPEMTDSTDALGPAAIASIASVGLSWYYFFVRGDRQRGLFVGLWPPTILAFASYFNQRGMQRQLETLTEPAASIKETIESVVGNR